MTITEQIAHLRSLMERATPAPWARMHGTEAVHNYVYHCWIPQTAHDADLIAAMHTAMPYILDRLERLEATVNDVKRHTDACPDGVGRFIHDRISMFEAEA